MFFKRLYQQGLLSKEDYEKLETVNEYEFDFLLEENMITKENLIKEIKKYYQIPYFDLEKESFSFKENNLLDESIQKKYNLLVLAYNESSVDVLVSRPYDYIMDEDLSILLSPRKINKYFAFKKEMEEAKTRKKESLSSKKETKEKPKKEESEKDSDNNAVINVDRILSEAFSFRSSDIHFEPQKDHIRIRYRIDGDLYPTKEELSPEDYIKFVSRIKVMGNMDPTEKRKPQDGRISNYKCGDFTYDMRVSTISTIFGEKVVLRIFENKAEYSNFSSLGFSKEQVKELNHIVSSSNGIILVAGETGSGKTTTLYSILNQLNKKELNACTIEDPVESIIPGVNQIQINEMAGITFSDTLKTLLRQDPDIIMVGEIRDLDTAETAIRASNTGHLVLSTIHTNNATSTISRLVSMGIEPYKISETIRGIISQKLIKKNCPYCKKEYHLSEREKEFLRITEEKYSTPVLEKDTVFYKGEGCPHCKNGFSGRTVVSELLQMKDEINFLITQDMNNAKFRSDVINNKNASFVPIELDAIKKAKEGIISISEVVNTFY